MNVTVDPVPAAPRTRGRTRLRFWVPLLVLLVGSVLARLPALINARGVHSDAAIVGLQAMHILDGEWSWFLWGAGYQASLDAALVAAGFAITGPSALTLMVVPLIGHLILVGLTFDILRRAVDERCALIACLPLVFAPQAVNGVALSAPRQWSITAVVLSVWLASRSVERPHAARWLAGSGFVAGGAAYLDLFTLQMMPGVALFALWCAASPSPRSPHRVHGLLGGALLGGAVLAWSRMQPVADAGKTGLTLDRLQANWELLVETCLPYLLGLKIFIPDGTVGADRWESPWALQVVQWAGLLGFLGAFVWAAVTAARRTAPPPLRRLGALGLLVTVSSLGGFLVSSMPVDLLSARYIAPIVWFAPFLFAPAAATLGARRFGLTLAPYIVATAVSGWLAFGPYVDGPIPVRDPRGVAEDEAALAAELRSRGVEHAAAQYWLSYRLGFLFEEDPVVVPFDEPGDRYRPYRTGFDRAPVVAYIFHPSEPRAEAPPFEVRLQEAGERYERVEVSGFTVLVHHRR
ncbi:glycosyltransferase family 39 protein [Pseudonocardia sp. H11422]|uniref:glycosyltransferase family 39 protein n=1 Tax=Pseudonocardia sp. H11422 TaxID=2835866 RepID=UPI001BDD61AE|nr:glycosyltransferase family 39 protein [Pseudonocardia sp. H11422]